MSEPGIQRGDAADRRRLAVGIDLAEDHVVDVAAGDARCGAPARAPRLPPSSAAGTSRKVPP